MGLRRNRGKQLLPKFLEEIARVLNKPKGSIQLLDLDKTDELWEAYINRRQSRINDTAVTFRRTWVANDIEEVRRLINKLRDGVVDRPIFLFRALSEYCGAIETTSKEIFEHAFQLISLDQEDLIAVNNDMSLGVLFSYSTDWLEKSSVEVYELFVWGDEWLAVLINE